MCLIDNGLFLLQKLENQTVSQTEKINEYPFVFMILLLLTIFARLWLAYGCQVEGGLLCRGGGKVSSSSKTAVLSER